MEIEAKITVQCDNCKQPISIKNGKKSGKEKDDTVESVEAVLNMPDGETKTFHLCSEECTRQLLNTRKKKNAKASLEISLDNNPVCGYNLFL